MTARVQFDKILPMLINTEISFELVEELTSSNITEIKFILTVLALYIIPDTDVSESGSVYQSVDNMNKLLNESK